MNSISSIVKRLMENRVYKDSGIHEDNSEYHEEFGKLITTRKDGSRWYVTEPSRLEGIEIHDAIEQDPDEFYAQVSKRLEIGPKDKVTYDARKGQLKVEQSRDVHSITNTYQVEASASLSTDVDASGEVTDQRYSSMYYTFKLVNHSRVGGN